MISKEKYVALDIGNVCIRIFYDRFLQYLSSDHSFKELPISLREPIDKLETGKISEREWLKAFGKGISELILSRSSTKKNNTFPFILNSDISSSPSLHKFPPNPKVSDDDIIFSIPSSDSLSDKELLNIWNGILGPPIKGMEQIIRSLTKKNIKFIFFSDTSRLHLLQIFATLPFANLISGGVYSFEVGEKKPHKAMYEAFEKKYGKPLIYIDDKPENIQAAKKIGWNAHRFINPGLLQIHINKLLMQHSSNQKNKHR